MAHAPQSEQLTLWQDAPESRQDAAGEAAAPPVRRYGPPPGRPRSKGAWGDLADGSGRDADPKKAAKFPPKIRRQMYARERFVRAMSREMRLQNAAVHRSNFLCNRLIGDRFPLVSFSELDYIPCAAQYHGHAYEREENDE